jgi:hypothetical protein
MTMPCSIKTTHEMKGSTVLMRVCFHYNMNAYVSFIVTADAFVVSELVRQPRMVVCDHSVHGDDALIGSQIWQLHIAPH